MSVRRDKRRPGFWLYVVDLPRGPGGKRRQRHRRGFQTRKAAEHAERQFLSHLDRGGDPFGDRTIFAEYIEAWLEHHATQVEPSTLRRYRQLMELHVLPRLGSMRIDQIRTAHVQATLDSIDRAPRTVRQARAVIGKSMRQAAAWGLIQASPVQATHAPKVERPEFEVPTPEGIQGLMDAALGTVWEVPMFLAAFTGARRGEILAIRWIDIEPERLRVRITRSLERMNGEFRFKEPKTIRSRREIAVPEFVIERLQRYRSQQGERRLAAGPVWRDFDLVCDRGDGGPLDPDSFSKAFKRFARESGIPAARLHDMRHAAATTMMERGVHPAVVSKTLGHASEAFTMSVYGHVRDEMLDQAADALEYAYRSR